MSSFDVEFDPPVPPAPCDMPEISLDDIEPAAVFYEDQYSYNVIFRSMERR